jgi:RNA polymerase sigma-70 factor (ECF subfamily)
MDSADDFAALAARVRAGDDAALAELVRRYEPRVRTVARSLLGPVLRRHLDSIDVAQSVHLVLLNGLRGDRFTLDGEGALVALLVTLVRRKVARHWRRVRREEAATAAEGPAPSPEALPDAALRLREGLDRIWPSLNDTERQLVELRLLGHSTAEAAAEMGVAANVLRVTLARLRARLRESGLIDDWL